MTSVDEFVNSSAWLVKVSGAQRGRDRHAAPAADTHGGRLAARAHPPRPLRTAPAPAMELADVPRHRPLAFDKMESLIKEMQEPETGVPVRIQKLFLSYVPAAFMGYDLIEWLMERFNLDETTNGNVEATNLANQLCQHGYFFPVNDSKNLVLKDDSSLYRFQSPYYWPWQPPRASGSGQAAPGLGPDNVEYAIYLVKRTLRNKQRHGLEEYELEAMANLKKNLAAKWDFITMQAEEQVRLAKERKKMDKVVADSQERAYWRVARPPPGLQSALEHCPVPVRARHPTPKKRTIHQLNREIEHLKASLDRTRVKTSIALEALLAYSETFAPYDPWLTPPQPPNPWVSDDTLFWQINSPLVEVPTEKRVQRWALSIEELVSDPTGLAEFTSFLRKEYSHENIRFWLAVQDLRRSSSKHIANKLDQIYEEFLKPGAPCEINIDGATAERVAEGLRSGSRYALDHAAAHVYNLLLKKDCYPRFIRSDHFQRLLAEGRTVLQKKAKFFNFGGQVKKKPGPASAPSGAGPGLSRRRGSDRSLSGSAHELAVCAAQPLRSTDPPPHSHSQTNLCDIHFRDPADDDASDVLPWESAARDGVYGSGPRRRQDSAADSGSSSSDVSAALAGAGAAGPPPPERRRLPQQSTLDGGLRGAPPPLRRLSAVEPRHLAPLASPPHSPRPPCPPSAAPAPPPHPTPTISVSSAPDDDSPPSPRSLAPSDEPSSVFASADVTPSDRKTLEDHLRTVSVCDSRTDIVVTDTEVRVCDAPTREASIASLRSDSKDSDRARSPEGDAARGPLSREPSTITEISPASHKDISSEIGDLPASSRETDGAEAPAPPPPPLPPTADSPAQAPPVPSVPETAAEAPTITPDSMTVAVKAEPTIRSTSEREPTVKPDLSVALVIPVTSAPKAALAATEVPKPETSSEAPKPVVASVAITEPVVTPPVVVKGHLVQEVPAAKPEPPSPEATPRPPVAPLAVCEDLGADDDVDKVPSAPQVVPRDSEAAAEPDATRIAHKDGLTSVSRPSLGKRDSQGGERKQRNDICPWEDENSCESEAPFVKTYATLGYL